MFLNKSKVSFLNIKPQSLTWVVVLLITPKQHYILPNPPLLSFFQKVSDEILNLLVPSVSKVSSLDMAVVFCSLKGAGKPVKLKTGTFTRVLWAIQLTS